MPGSIQGRVASISESGNLVTDITRDQLSDAPTDERTAVKCGEHITQGVYSSDHHQPPMTFLAVAGETCLELEIVGDSAKIMLGVSVGEEVVVEWA